MGSWGDIASLARIAAGGKQQQRVERNQQRSGSGGGSSGGGSEAFANALAAMIRGAVAQRQSHDQASQLFDAYRRQQFGGPERVTFGQGVDKKGKPLAYGGFKTEGELKAASLGHGRNLYSQDQQRASDLHTAGTDLEHRTQAAYQDAIAKMHAASQAKARADRPDVLMHGGHIITADEAKALEARSMAPTQAAIAAIMGAVGRGASPQGATSRVEIPQPTPGMQSSILGPQAGMDQQYDPHAQAVMDAAKAADAATTSTEHPYSAMTSRVEIAPQQAKGETELGISHGQDLTYAQRAKLMPTGFLGALTPAREQIAKQRDAQALTDAQSALYGPDYENQMAAWRDESLGRATTVEDLAQQLASTPFDQYAQKGASDYGVDPNLSAGWFGPSLNAPEFKAQRDTQSISDQGMPYTEAQAAIADQQKADVASQKDAEQQALEAFQSDAFDQLGLDGHQVAQAANMTDPQLAQYLQDPSFQSANNAVKQALSDASDGDYSTLADLQQQLEFTDPGMYQIFQVAYGDQFKAAIDALNAG